MNDSNDTERKTSAAPARRPGFGLVRKRFFLPLFAVILLALASPFVLLRIESTRIALIEWILGQSGARGRIRISIAEVERFDPNRLTIAGVRMDVRGPDGAWQRIGEIRRVDAHWSLREAIAGHARMRELRADSVRIVSAGVRALSMGEKAAPRRKKSLLETGLPSAAIDRLQIGPLIYPTERGDSILAGLALSAMQSSEQGFFTRIDSGSVACDCCGRFEIRGGVVSMVTGGQVRVSGVSVNAPGFRGRLRGDVDFSGTAPAVDGRLECERLDPTEIARRFRAPVDFVAGDSLTGLVLARISDGRIAAEFDVAGRLRGESLQAKGGVQGAGFVWNGHWDVTAEAGRAVGEARANLRERRCEATVDITNVAAASEWLPWFKTLAVARRFDGSLQAEVSWPQDEPVAIDGEARLVDAQPWSIPAREIHFVGRVTAGEAVVAETLTAEFKGGGTLTAAGRWPLGDGSVDIDAAVENFDLASFPASWNVQLAGRSSGNFRVSGDPRAPEISGTARGQALEYRGWRADSLEFDPVVFVPVHWRGECSAELRNLVRGSAADGVDVRLNAIRETERIVVDAQMAGEPGRLELRGEVDPRGDVLLRDLSLDMRRFGAWSLERPFHGGWSRERIWSDTLALRSRTARLRAAANWRRIDGDIRARLMLTEMEAATIARMAGLADTLDGTCSCEIEVSERLPDPRVVAHVSFENLSVDSLALGTGELRALWSDRNLRVGPVAVRGPGHGVTIDSLRIDSGRTLLATLSSKSALDSLHFAPWRARARIDSLSLEAFELLAARTQLSPALQATNANVRLIGGRQVPIRVLTPWDSTGQAATSEPVLGTLRGTIELAGSAVAPELSCEASVAGLRVTGDPLGDLEFRALYADSLATLERFEFAGERGSARARGYYPLALELLPLKAELLMESAGGQIALDKLDLAVLSALTRWVPEASGSVSGQLVLEGTGQTPELRGSLDMADGGFRIPGRSERIHSADGQIDVRRNRLEIRSLKARTGRDGTVTAVGSFGGPDDFDLSAHVENARVFDEGLYEFLVTADLHAYTSPSGEAGALVPALRGTATVHSGTLTQNLTEPPSVKPAPPKTPWRIDLDVETSGQVRVRQANANAELGEGSLVISYRWPYWTLTGTQEISSGTYRLLNNTFTITEGTLEFRDTGAGPEVTTDIQAETTVAIPDESGGPGETVTIQVNVHGKPEELSVDLSSVPALGEEEILELLSYGRFTRSGRFEPVAGTQWIVLNTLVDRIESSLLEQNPIFSRLTVGTGSSTDDPVRLTLRPIVRPGFMVNYSQDLTQDPAGELLFDYRLSRMLFLHGGMLHRGEGGGGLIDEYSLDLKFRFEYE